MSRSLTALLKVVYLVAFGLSMFAQVVASAQSQNRQLYGAQLFDINERWDSNLLTARFFAEYTPIHNPSAIRANTYNYDGSGQLIFAENGVQPPSFMHQQAASQNGVLSGFVESFSDFSTSRGFSNFDLKSRFVRQYEPILKEYIVRLIANGRNGHGFFPIRDIGEGKMRITLPAGNGRKRTQDFLVNESILKFTEVTDFLNCYIDNGKEVSDRVKDDCGPGIIARMNVNKIKVPLDQLTKKVAEVGYCFGIDPLAFTGMLFRETSFTGSYDNLNGAGFTQLTNIAILEIERQVNPGRYEDAGLSSTVSNVTPEQNQSTLANLQCFMDSERLHKIPLEITSAEERQRYRQSDPNAPYNFLVRNWLLGLDLVGMDLQPRMRIADKNAELKRRINESPDSEWIKNEILDRQFAYGAVLKKGKMTRTLRAMGTERSIYWHYYYVGYMYNGNESLRKAYAKDLAENYPAVMGLKIEQSAKYSCSALFPQRDRFVIDPSTLGDSHRRCNEELNPKLQEI